jgi:hypothetical protein
MAGRKKRMTTGAGQLLSCGNPGWKVDVDDVAMRIVLQDPSPDMNWLHLLRQQDVAKNEPRGQRSNGE